jgi:hypothetical protein
MPAFSSLEVENFSRTLHGISTDAPHLPHPERKQKAICNIDIFDVALPSGREQYPLVANLL